MSCDQILNARENLDADRWLTINELRKATRLPAAWIKREADAGRLPCIRAGSQRMFNLDQVRAFLNEQALKRVVQHDEL